MTVSQLNEQAKALLESHFVNISVTGEISRLTRHSSGHWYFSLKDEKSVISVAMYKFSNQLVKFEVKDGLKVTLNGKLTIYTASGAYQFIANKMFPLGIGELDLAFKELKEKLSNEGLFDLKFKKQLPKLPKNVAIVTSLTSAAYQDMLKVIKDRFVLSKFTAYNSLVQGDMAANNIIKILNAIDSLGFDAIVLARGGGSIEDLWCFNDENLARTIFKLKTPLISAIGHEIDYSISDFVADHRALTPTAAMIDLLPDSLAIMQWIDRAEDSLNNFISSTIRNSLANLNLYELNLKTIAINQKIEKFFLNIENNKINLKSIIENKLRNSMHKIKEIEITLEQRKYFFEKTTNMVQIQKDGKIISLDKLKVDDKVTLYSQKTNKIAIIKS